MCHFTRTVVSILTLAFGSTATHAQIVTDGSVGQQVTLIGGDIEIGQALGTRAGNNLFHSFETFNIGPDGVVTFTGASDINNVISRVTGGEQSNIQGTLRSEVGTADFYFINPAGVTFGAGGSVDVPGAFHLSTATELRFSDSSVFSLNSASSVLSIAEPEAFGFLGNEVGSINFDGTEIAFGGFDFNKETTLSANSLSFNDATVVTTGEMRIAAVGDTAAVFNLQTGTQSQLDGSIEIVGDESIVGAIDNLSVEAGTIDLIGGQLISTDGIANIRSQNLTISDNANISTQELINVEVSNQLSLTNGGQISNSTQGDRDAGVIQVSAGELLLDGQGTTNLTGINSNASIGSTGNAGRIEVTVDGLTNIKNGAVISSSIESFGNAGTVKLTTGDLSIDRQLSANITGIFTLAFSGSTGDAGNIEINVMDHATIENGGVIASGTFSESNAGTVQLSARRLDIDAQDSENVTGIISQANPGSTGDAGGVDITVTELVTVQDGAVISSDSFSVGGDAGAVKLTAGQLLIDGKGSNFGTAITSEAVANAGSGGDVEILITDQATIQNGGFITTATFSDQDAGTVYLSAGQLLIDRQDNEIFTGISSGTDVLAGNAGNVEVNIDGQAIIQNGGEINTNTFGVGNAGFVQLSAANLLVDGQGSEYATGIFSQAEPDTTGDAGFVQVSTLDTITLTNNAEISTQSSGGSAGPISITANAISSNATQIITTTNSPTANGGNITINSNVFALQDTIIQANADSGSGGTITIDSNALVPFNNQLDIQLDTRFELSDSITGSGNVIQAVAPTGVSIPPAINAPEVDVSGALSALDSTVGEAPEVASNPCTANLQGAPSTLVNVGRGTLPSSNSQRLPVQEVTDAVKQAAKLHRNNDRALLAQQHQLPETHIEAHQTGQQHNVGCG